MARTATLADLRTRTRQLADVEGSTFVTDTDVDAYLSDAYASMYRAVVGTSWGEDYYSSSATKAVGANTTAVALEADFYKLLKLDWVIGADRFEMKRVPLREQNDWINDPNFTVSSVPGYCLRGSSIVLIPPPPSAGSMLVTYIPAPAVLTAGGTNSFDGVAGWDRFCVWRAVVDVKTKEGDAEGAAFAQRKADKELAEILADAPVRDAHMPLRIAMVEY